MINMMHTASIRRVQQPAVILIVYNVAIQENSGTSEHYRRNALNRTYETLTMNHAIEEYIGQIQELKTTVKTQGAEIDYLVTENLSLHQKIRELETMVFGGTTK